MVHLLLPSTKIKRRTYNQIEDVLEAGMSIKNYASNIVVSERDSALLFGIVYLTSWCKEKKLKFNDVLSIQVNFEDTKI